MTYEIGIHISIGDYEFTRCNNITIVKDVNMVQDTSVIKLPLSARVKAQDAITSVETAKIFKPGDYVVIRLEYKGYYSGYEFGGYVRKINPSQPLEIECEDAIYLLRSKNIKKSWKKTTLKEVLEEIVAGTKIEVSDDIPVINLEPFVLKDVDGAFALQKISDELKLRSFIDATGKLWCGMPYERAGNIVKYRISGDECNVVSANDLKWRSADEIKLKVKAVCLHKDNTKTVVEVGDEDGALRTFNFYNIATKAELERIAQQKLKEIKYDGYEGSIKTKLLPYAEPGMVAQLTDEMLPERSGNYYIESVKTTLSTSGINRSVKLGLKV